MYSTSVILLLQHKEGQDREHPRKCPLCLQMDEDWQVILFRCFYLPVHPFHKCPEMGNQDPTYRECLIQKAEAARSSPRHLRVHSLQTAKTNSFLKMSEIGKARGLKTKQNGTFQEYQYQTKPGSPQQESSSVHSQQGLAPLSTDFNP